MIKHKVYLFFKITDDPDLYAYTLNRDYAEFFMNIRNMKKFMMKTKKIDDINLTVFQNSHRMEMLFMNVLTDGKDSFDFVTTYGEEYMLGYECEKIQDSIYDIDQKLTIVPFIEKASSSIKDLHEIIDYSMKHEKPMGSFNTFKIFTKVFKDTLV